MAAQRDLIREWREGFARCVLHIDFKPLSDWLFRASIERIFDDLHIVRATLTPGITFRDEELIKDGHDGFVLMISPSKNVPVAQRGQILRLGRGDAALINPCEMGSVGSHQNFRMMPVDIPTVELAIRGVRPGDAIMRRLPARSEALQLLRAYIRSLESKRLRAWS